MARNLASDGNGCVNPLTHGGYSSRGLAIGVRSFVGSLDFGYMFSRPGIGVPGFNANDLVVVEK